VLFTATSLLSFNTEQLTGTDMNFLLLVSFSPKNLTKKVCLQGANRCSTIQNYTQKKHTLKQGYGSSSTLKKAGSGSKLESIRLF